MRTVIAITIAAAACTNPKGESDAAVNPCADIPLVAGGSVELGLGAAQGGVFQPITDHEDLNVQLGSQGLWMFVMNARRSDMSVGAGELEGVVYYSLLDQSGGTMSIQTGCRVLEFAPLDGAYLGLRTGYALPFSLDYNSTLEGTIVTIHLELRDHEGHRAVDDRTVVAHLPMALR